MTTPDRIARVERTTRESSIVVELNLDGSGKTDISTGVPFYDHMLTAFGQHGSFDLTVQAKGDIEIEAHHTVEDTAIVIGQALGQALGPLGWPYFTLPFNLAVWVVLGATARRRGPGAP